MTTHRVAQEQLADIAKGAIVDAVVPYLHLVLTAGISARGIFRLIEVELVRAAAQLNGQGKSRSRSRISLVTGVPRGQVALILGSKTASKIEQSGWSAWRALLDTWASDRRFRGNQQLTCPLPIFGPSPSFERLVQMKGRGIPVRAVLDELLDLGVVKLLDRQRVELVVDLSIQDQKNLTEASRLARRRRTATASSASRGTSAKQVTRKNLKRPR